MDLVKQFPIGVRVVELPELPSEQYGTVIEHRQMSGREGLYPVVQWDKGYQSFSSIEWGLKQAGTRLERLKGRISQEFTHCTVTQRGNFIYIQTPGAEFRILNGKLSPYIPSLRYKALSAVVTEVWHGCS